MDNSKHYLSSFGKRTFVLMLSVALLMGCAASRSAQKDAQSEAAKAPEMRQITSVSASEDADSIDIYNSAGTVVDHTRTINDSGTVYTEGTMTTGA